MIDYRVYLVTDDPSRYKGNWLDSVRAAVEGGVTCVQYRDTESSNEEKLRRLRALRDAIGSTPIIVNNDVELAAAIRAEGVHVGQQDLPPQAVRAIVGPTCEIGLSITAWDQTRAAHAAYRAGWIQAVGIGPVFDARKTKRDASAAMGLKGLRCLTSELNEIPNCAIGGINLDNAPSVLTAGAQGLAVVSAFSQSENPYEVAKNFALLFNHSRQ